MNLEQSIAVAIRALGANKLRSGLTMLGIVIGVAAVIALVAIGRGSQERITEGIQGLGTNLLFIRPGSVQQQGVRTGVGGAQTLTYDDAIAIAENISYVTGVTAERSVQQMLQIIAGGQNYPARVIGVTPDYQYVRNYYPALGTFITEDDVDRKAATAVLGAHVAQELFGDDDPLGQTIRISVGGRIGSNWQVVGVMEAKGGGGLGSLDEVVLVPLTTLNARISALLRARGVAQIVSLITIQVDDKRNIPAAVQDIGELLRQRHGVAEDDFQIQSQEDIIAAINETARTFTILLASIAGISLLVGGIGIMNIMLVSVTERTREIGIRKAVGARRQDILLQFLVEAITVSVGGGGVGAALGVVASRLARGQELLGMDIQPVNSPQDVLLAFSVAAAIGVFFGMYPAVRASRLNPIEALRYE